MEQSYGFFARRPSVRRCVYRQAFHRQIARGGTVEVKRHNCRAEGRGCRQYSLFTRLNAGGAEDVPGASSDRTHANAVVLYATLTPYPDTSFDGPDAIAAENASEILLMYQDKLATLAEITQKPYLYDVAPSSLDRLSAETDRLRRRKDELRLELNGCLDPPRTLEKHVQTHAIGCYSPPNTLVRHLITMTRRCLEAGGELSSARCQFRSSHNIWWPSLSW